jgi:hypothetical protein
MYRVVETTVRGLRKLSAIPNRDACLEARRQQLAERLDCYQAMLPVITRYPANDLERERALALEEDVLALLGRRTLSQRVRRMGAVALATRWNLRLKLKGDGLQPKTIVTRFNAAERDSAGCPIPYVNLEPVREGARPPLAAAAFVAR